MKYSLCKKRGVARAAHVRTGGGRPPPRAGWLPEDLWCASRSSACCVRLANDRGDEPREKVATAFASEKEMRRAPPFAASLLVLISGKRGSWGWDGFAHLHPNVGAHMSTA